MLLSWLRRHLVVRQTNTTRKTAAGQVRRTTRRLEWRTPRRRKGPGASWGARLRTRTRDFFLGAPPAPPLRNVDMRAQLIQEEAQRAAEEQYLAALRARLGTTYTRDAARAAVATDAEIQALHRAAHAATPPPPLPPVQYGQATQTLATVVRNQRKAPAKPRAGKKKVPVGEYYKPSIGKMVRSHKRAAPRTAMGTR